VPDGKHLVMEWSSFPHSPHPGGGPLGGGTPEKVVFAYHERTMHHPHRYAASPPTMDWASQPDPFRRYDAAGRHVRWTVTGSTGRQGRF
jgi:hypothetical protein